MAHPTTISASPSSLDRQKLAELTSATGALVLGIGVGIFFAAPLAAVALGFVVVGTAQHGWGMFDRHRSLLAATRTVPMWWSGLYAVCWLGLAALLAYSLYSYAT